VGVFIQVRIGLSEERIVRVGPRVTQAQGMQCPTVATCPSTPNGQQCPDATCPPRSCCSHRCSEEEEKSTGCLTPALSHHLFLNLHSWPEAPLPPQPLPLLASSDQSQLQCPSCLKSFWGSPLPCETSGPPQLGPAGLSRPVTHLSCGHADPSVSQTVLHHPFLPV
jgi:hypothetical protein